MKVGILTFFRPINYGAFLQAYALSHRLNQEKDIQAEIIDYHMPAEDDYYKNGKKFSKNIPYVLFNRKRFKKFQEQQKLQILSNRKCCSSKIETFSSFVDNQYDIIIVGSDEVWKVDGYRGFPTPYFLPGELNCKKVAYAASGRTPFNILDESNKELLNEYLNDFEYIGVRDYATYQEVEKVIVQKDKLHLNYDPIFVYDFKPDAENGRKLLKKYFGVSQKKKVIGVMLQEGLHESPNLSRYLKNNYGKEFEFISLYEWNAFLKACPKITPFEWIDLIAAVDGIISMYFHGVCFSAICGTPFLAVEKRSRNDAESKLYDILFRLNLSENYVFGIEDAIMGGKIDGFLDAVRKGKKLDFHDVKVASGEEFKQFVEMLRNMN